MATDSNQSIEEFLEGLKLAEKYSNLFITNGFITVGDCHGITEDTLKRIGITLPGHYRRILSKLPGCTVRKPPRGKGSISTTDQATDHCFSEESGTNNATEDVENVYNELSSTSTHRQTSDSTALYDHSNLSASPKHHIPSKPPRSPENIRKSYNFENFENSSRYNSIQSQSASRNISEAVETLLLSQNCGESSEKLAQNNSDLYDHFPPNVDDSETFDTYNSLSSDSKGRGSFPDPPSWIYNEPSNRLSSSDKEIYEVATFSTGSKDSYDILDLNVKKPETVNSWQSETPAVQEAYSHIEANNTIPSPSPVENLIIPPPLSPGNFQIPPARLGNYEEILFESNETEFCDEQETYEEAVLNHKPTCSSTNEADLYQSASDLQYPVETEKVSRSTKQSHTRAKSSSSSQQDSSIRRSKSFDIYDITSESDEDTCSSNDSFYHGYPLTTTSANSTGYEPKARMSTTLPRTSATLPGSSSTFRSLLNQSPFKHLQRKRAAEGSTESDADIFNTDLAIQRNNSIYQTIELPTNPQPIKPVKERTKLSVVPNTPTSSNVKTRLSLSKKQRPVSTINLIHPHSNVSFKPSEENLDGFSKEFYSNHKRAVSTSDAKILSAININSISNDQNQSCQYASAADLGPSLDSPLMQKRTKKGWLYKHGGREGRAPLRKRWVVLDGEELIYYESETKTDVSKGVIPIDVIKRVQGDKVDSKVFNISTTGGRNYLFTADSPDEKTLWMSALEASMMLKEKSPNQFKPGGAMYMPYREGFLKLDGNRHKHYFATKGEQLAYYKSSDEFHYGQPIAKLSMKIATVKEIDKKKFQVVFPFRTFTLTADNEDEKRAWVEALSEAVAEGLSDYQVVKEIWAVDENRKCADCGREDPDWASINLAIVICKHCAGVHRDLGVHNSKVRSLKMDVKIWNTTMKNMLLCLGNKAANAFWSAKLTPSEAIKDMADKKQRAWHITGKYIELRYLGLHPFHGDQKLMNQELIESVRRNDLVEAYKLVFSGADPNCATGKEHGKTPYLLARYLEYDIMAEFLYQNGATDDVSPYGHVTVRSNCVRKKDSLPKSQSKPPLLLKDHLFKYGGDFRSQVDEQKGRIFDFNMRRPGEFQKRWCVLENNVFKYFDPERNNNAKDEIDCLQLLSIGKCLPEQAVKAGFQHCFEVGRSTGRTYLFCSDRSDTFSKWLNGLMQAMVPPHVQNSMKHDMTFDRIGRLQMKSQLYHKKPSEWRPTWCRLKGNNFSYFHQDSLTMEEIDLRKLVQIGLDLTQDGTGNTNGVQTNKELPITFMLVFREKSYYFRSDTKPDSESWFAAIKKADCDPGPNLVDQQQTAEGVPIILEKFTTFIEQFGLSTRGIYRLSGTHRKTSQLLRDFQHNARETQMHDSDIDVHDVANALKRWLKSLPGSLLTQDLHEEWIKISEVKIEHHENKLRCYKLLIEKLPAINRISLKVLLCHLNNVANHSKENEMTIHNLAIVFGPTLLEWETEEGNSFTRQTSQEITCIEDLLKYYDWLFDVTDVDREKERMILEAKEKISMAAQQQNMLTTLDYDMMVPVYLQSKEEKCVNFKVNMTAGELIARICKTYKYPWKTTGLFEVISDGGAERPLHFTEHVLSVIKSWEMPSSNYLLVKQDYVRDKLRWMDKTTFSPGGILCEGELKLYESSKKKWIKLFASLKQSETGLTVNFLKNQEVVSVLDSASSNWRKRSLKVQSISRRIGSNFDAKNISNISLAHYNAYLGFDKSKTVKITGSYQWGLILAYRGEATKYFAFDSENTLYRWYAGIIQHKFPNGFSPPNSPVPIPETEIPLPRKRTNEDALKRMTLPLISASDLGEEARKAALQRMSSTGSEDTTLENIYETASAIPGSLDAFSTNQTEPSSKRPVSLYPMPNDARPQRYLASPVETQRPGSFLNMKLQSELSSVLKKRTEQ